MIDAEKLTKWSKEIYETAVAHGWHEEKHSPEHYLGLIMTEVAEAVEADRKGRRSKAKVCYARGSLFVDWYNGNVKNSMEEEFADIVIRLLDMAVALYGDFEYSDFPVYRKIGPCEKLSLVENLWYFVKYKLYCYHPLISEAIVFIYDLADNLGIDLDQHIEWKMRYNSLRDYKHGGKKY